MFGWILIGWLTLELGDMSISITLGGESQVLSFFIHMLQKC